MSNPAIPIILNYNYWILQTVAMMLTALAIPRLTVSGPIGAFGAALGLSLVNATVWDAALFFALPDSLTARAALLFLANGIVFWLLVKLLPGIEVQGLLPALIAPIVFTISTLLVAYYGPLIDWEAVLEFCGTLLSQIKNYFLNGEYQAIHAVRHDS